MRKYGEAAVIEMIMGALPEIAKNVAEPLSKVDKITMYGEGNSAKLLSDIVTGTTQVTEGISAGMGIDIKSLITGALGGKMVANASNNASVNANSSANFSNNASECLCNEKVVSGVVKEDDDKVDEAVEDVTVDTEE